MKEKNIEPTFSSLRKAVEALKNAGFQISRSKMSRDRKTNLIRFNENGSVNESEIRAYSRNLKRMDGNIDDLNDMQGKKTAREVKSLDLKIEKQQFELEKDKDKYIPRSDFELELAARAAIFETGIKHAFSAKVQDLIAIVGGRPEKSPDFLEELNKYLETELNSYATTKRFQVIFIGDES